jgi:hypothetical protein
MVTDMVMDTDMVMVMVTDTGRAIILMMTLRKANPSGNAFLTDSR